MHDGYVLHLAYVGPRALTRKLLDVPSSFPSAASLLDSAPAALEMLTARSALIQNPIHAVVAGRIRTMRGKRL